MEKQEITFGDWDDEDEPEEKFVFKYKDPILDGYTKVNIKKSELKRISPALIRHTRLIFANVDCYIRRAQTSNQKDIFKVEKTANWVAKTLMVISAPVFIFIDGFKEYSYDLGRAFNQKQKGAFVSETIRDNGDGVMDFDELNKILAKRHPQV